MGYERNIASRVVFVMLREFPRRRSYHRFEQQLVVLTINRIFACRARQWVPLESASPHKWLEAVVLRKKRKKLSDFYAGLRPSQLQGETYQVVNLFEGLSSLSMPS